MSKIVQPGCSATPNVIEEARNGSVLMARSVVR